jgi:hypothetical protein
MQERRIRLLDYMKLFRLKTRLASTSEMKVFSIPDLPSCIDSVPQRSQPWNFPRLLEECLNGETIDRQLLENCVMPQSDWQKGTLANGSALKGSSIP